MPLDHSIPVPEDKLIEVAAGLLFRNHKLLIARRRSSDHLGGLWEFPGGKREVGESFETCLVRELHEELATHVEVRDLFDEVRHSYPEKRVHIKFYTCRWLRGEPQPVGAAALAWVHRAELKHYEFPPADAVLLQKLDACAWPDF